MRVTFLCGAAALCFLASGPALAASATPEEAQRLQTLFERYTGKAAGGAPSAVVVTPSGDDYKVNLDLARLMAPLDALGFKIAVTGPYAWTLTPRGDGTWRVQSGDFPALALTKGDQTTTLKYEGYRTDGVFDPKLRAMREQTSTLSGATSGTESPAASTEQRYTAQVTTLQTAHDAGDGSVTMDMHQAAANLDYALTVRGAPAAAGAPTPAPVSVTATLPDASGDTTLSHLSTASLLDLWAFLVAHPSEPAIRADSGRLKAILQAILAPGPSGFVKGRLGKLNVTTPVGAFALDSLTEAFELGGDRASQTARFGLHYAGLSVPADRLPAWAVKLVPTALDLDVTFGPLHLMDGLSKAVAEADLSAGQPLTDAQGQDVLHALAGPGGPTVTLQPSTLRSALVTLNAQGTSRMDANGQPTGDLTVTASGLDDALDALNSSAQDDPTAAQVAAVLTLAKQTAKAAGPGLYSWVIQTKPSKPLTVNGTPLAQPPSDDGDQDSSPD